LDDHVQYFLAGAEKDNIDFSEVTLELSRWYACDEVIHHSGLCERTIAIDVKEHPSAIYEELDMARNDRTKNLPFVNGAIAGFCRYAGAPIVTEAGLSIGTVFVMDTRPSSRLNAAQRRCLTETAGNVMRQLTQVVQALEGGRMMRYHSASASLIQQRTSPSKLLTNSRKLSEVGQYPDSVSQFYRYAAETMRKSFDSDGVYFQDIQVVYRSAQNTSGSRKGHMIATSLKDGVSTPACLAASDMDRLVKCFPHGTFLYQLSEWFQPVLSIWQHREDHTPPDLMFVSQQDLATFQEQCGQKFANVKKVVICTAVGSESARDQQKIQEAASAADAVIIGPVSPSKLWKVVTTCFSHVHAPKTHNAIDCKSLQKQKDLDGLASLSLSHHWDDGERDGERKTM
jgi:hypothetical protein